MLQWNKPKSVRQIGSVSGRKRIYMEDYVVRFARKMAEESRGEEKAAVLLGGTYLFNDEKIYQISGIVEIANFANRNSVCFSSDMWDRLYTQIKENFTDLEIVGWFYSKQGFLPEDASSLLEIHKQNFQHRDKVLFVHDTEDREDRFFLYVGGRFEKQKGYFIYYEKNPEMLAYMEKESDRHVHIVEQEDDRVIRNIRGIMEEKEKTRQRVKKRQKRESRFGYSVAALLALILVVVGAAALKNERTMEELKKQVAQLQNIALGNEMIDGETTVETMSGGIVKMTATPAAVEPVPTDSKTAGNNSLQSGPVSQGAVSGNAVS